MSIYIEKHGEEVKDGDRGKAIQGERKKGQYSFFTYLTIITIIKKKKMLLAIQITTAITNNLTINRTSKPQQKPHDEPDTKR